MQILALGLRNFDDPVVILSPLQWPCFNLSMEMSGCRATEITLDKVVPRGDS